MKPMKNFITRGVVALVDAKHLPLRLKDSREAESPKARPMSPAERPAVPAGINSRTRSNLASLARACRAVRASVRFMVQLFMKD